MLRSEYELARRAAGVLTSGTMSRAALVLSVAVALAAAPACGGGGGERSVATDDLAAAFRDAWCSYLVRCGQIESAAACHRIGIGVDTRLTASERAAIDAGKAVYDGVQAGRCADAIAGKSCDVTASTNRDLPIACVTYLAGTAAGGAACASDAECASQQCDTAICPDACCPGTCVADAAPHLAKRGESCERSLCEPGNYCDGATCAALKSASSPCLTSAECGYGLACEANACVVLPALDQPCTGACRDEGTTCSPASHTCVKVALAGSDCASSSDCGKFYRCDATKRCTAGVPLGGMCSATVRCADDRVFCDIPDGENQGTCTAPRANDEPCVRDDHCASRSCDPAAHKCRPEPACVSA